MFLSTDIKLLVHITHQQFADDEAGFALLPGNDRAEAENAAAEAAVQG